MWTLNDFLAYEMIFGWSTHGKLTCPYCMKNNKAFTLTNGGKAFIYLFIVTESSYQVIIHTETIKTS